jgi:hypothetical protein
VDLISDEWGETGQHVDIKITKGFQDVIEGGFLDKAEVDSLDMREVCHELQLDPSLIQPNWTVTTASHTHLIFPVKLISSNKMSIPFDKAPLPTLIKSSTFGLTRLAACLGVMSCKSFGVKDSAQCMMTISSGLYEQSAFVHMLKSD